jgi:hypothetical protein
MVIRRFIFAVAFAFALTPLYPAAVAQAQDEKLGTLGRTYIAQGMKIERCTTTNDCTVKMTRTIKTAGLIAQRATSLLKQGDVNCVKPALKFGAVYKKQMTPAIKAWMRNQGFANKKRFMNAVIAVAATLPDMYHRC